MKVLMAVEPPPPAGRADATLIRVVSTDPASHADCFVLLCPCHRNLSTATGGRVVQAG